MTLIPAVKALLTGVADVFAQGYPQQQALISGFLQDPTNAIIRVYVSAASGMGHQATTVLIMNRLTALGFNQNFQVIYDPAAGTAGKLAKLIPGFDPNGPDPQPIGGTNITVITQTYFNANAATYPTVNFGITGGFDTNATNLASAPAAAPASKGVNVNFFLKLQPFQWNKQNAIQQPGQLQAAFIQIANLAGAPTIKRGYYVQAPVAPTAASFGTDAAGVAKATAYNTIITATTGGAATVNLLPIYGIGDTGLPGYVEANPNIRPENVLLYLITAIRYAQQFSGVASLQRGAILVVIASVSAGPYTNLAQLLEGVASPTRNTAVDNLNQFVTDVGAVAGVITANNVEIVNYTDGDNAWLTAKIAAVQAAAKVLVIKMEGLPLGAFDYMYASSSLPCLLEGKGTANLVLNLNKPYLNLLKDLTVVYPTLPLNAGANGPEAVLCNDAVLDFRDSAATTNGKLPAAGLVLNPPSAGLQTTAMYKVANLTTLSYTNGNALQTYFAALQTFFQTPQEDKLFLSLLTFMSHVNTL